MWINIYFRFLEKGPAEYIYEINVQQLMPRVDVGSGLVNKLEFETNKRTKIQKQTTRIQVS